MKHYIIQFPVTCEYVSRLNPLTLSPEPSGAMRFKTEAEAKAALGNAAFLYNIVNIRD